MTNLSNDDLQVSIISESLLNCHLEVVVTGSIGAVESVRFVRALRRLGAKVSVTLSEGGAQFITPTALEWASGAPVTTKYSGTTSHLANADACIVAPASASMISKIAHGATNCHASAKIASYLGSSRPVILVPNMHSSLNDSPAVRENLAKLRGWLKLIEARREESKLKFPDPASLADQVAHLLNLNNNGTCVLVTMGSTRGYVDDVRFLTNYSTGATGKSISEELYRQGFVVHVVSGPVQHSPLQADSITNVQTHQQMSDAIQSVFADQKPSAAIFAASVLDFEPEVKLHGKLRSTNDAPNIKLKKTAKLLALAPADLRTKIAFKLEVGGSDLELDQLAAEYAHAYSCSMVITNRLNQVSNSAHLARLHSFESGKCVSQMTAQTNGEIAKIIARHIKSQNYAGQVK
jgi:phosphopantothenoylcysteine decarboxylase/phosphopantothenate--cysteine ligase